VLCLTTAAPLALGQGNPVCPNVPPPSEYFSGNAAGNCSTVSSSFTSSQQIETTQVDQRLDQYMTRLTANLFGGPVVYDQTFNLPFSDAVVQDAVLAAQLALQGLASPLTFTGPDLLSNSTTLVGSSSNTVIDSQNESEFFALTDTIGPNTILVGPLGACAGITITGPSEGTPFGCEPGLGIPIFVADNSSDIRVNIHTLTQIFQTTTTTNTFLTTEHYNLVGTPGDFSSVPEPSSLMLAASGFAGLGLLRVKRRRR